MIHTKIEYEGVDSVDLVCDVYLLQLGFHPVAVVGRLVQKLVGDNTRGEKAHK
jgi:hypothetical protein